MEKSPVRAHAIAVGLLLALCAAIYGQTLRHEYIGLDDPFYVSQNPHISGRVSAQEFQWAMTDIVVNNWHPVTMLSHAATAWVFGPGPGPQHAVNVALHAINAVLVYALFWRLTAAWWPTMIAAALFAVHPLRVESVAWISDRKGLLCAFFTFIALLAYERYARTTRPRVYAAILVAFSLALLSKPAAVALPFALLLFDVWPLRRFELGNDPFARRAAKLLIEKLPLFALSAASSVITYIVQRDTGAVQSAERYSLGVRVANAIESYVIYLADTFIPYHLSPQYPHPGEAVYGPLLYASVTVFLVLTAAALLAWRRPWFAVGWFWFCGMLVPAIGVIQVAHQARADRYMYLPQIGLLIAIAWGLDELRRRVSWAARSLTLAVMVWLVALSAAAFVQTRLWKDDFTLFKYTVDRAPGSSQARYFLGAEYIRRGDLENAEKQFRAAIECKLLLPEAFNNLGVIELRRGDFTQSADHFAVAAQLEPSKPEWLVNYGVALFNIGRRAEASAAAKRALQLDPAYPRALELRDACRADAKKP